MGMEATLVMSPKQFELTSNPLSHGSATRNLVSIGPAVIEEKKFEYNESECLGGRSLNDLDLWY